MQNHKSLKWNIAAKVIEVRPGNKSYWVRVVTGETFLRNRMFLRKWDDKNAKNAPGMQFHQKKQPEIRQEVEPQSQVLTRRMSKNAEVDKTRNAKSRQFGNQNLHGQQLQHRNLRTVQTSSNTATPQLSNRNAQPRNAQTWENSADRQLRNQNAQHGNAWTRRNSADQQLRNKSVTPRHSQRQHGKQHSWENGHSPGQQTRNNTRNYKNKARSGQQNHQTHGIYGDRRQEYFSSSSASNWRRPPGTHFCSVSTLQPLENHGQSRVSSPGHRPGHGNGSDPRGVSHWFCSEVSGDRSRLDNPDSFRWNSL